MQKDRGRYELKHYINYADVIGLRARLPFVAKPDKNSINGNGYRVKSLYFDNYKDKALKEKIDGVDGREKFRLRIYNNNTSFIRLEKKSKKNGISYKEGTTISEEDCRRLLKGDFAVLKEKGNPLCLELYAKIHYQQLRPKSIVEYWREAYVYPAGNVRVTLDYDIRTGQNIYDFFSDKPAPIPVCGVYVLEVKYDSFLPEIIRGMVSLSGRMSTSFSKYAAARII
ncbi:MAG TPA: polyphosphate polymerase domain-containing protein [Clostridiaceae bacterium]|nr:polyphosphate polymerase domain-containing protein [Clostridiaceae bacterium]